MVYNCPFVKFAYEISETEFSESKMSDELQMHNKFSQSFLFIYFLFLWQTTYCTG